MTEDQFLTYCKVQCGNNYHLQCLKVWLDYKISSHEAQTCPMCRCNLGDDALKNLEKEQLQFENKFITHTNLRCEACKAEPIIGIAYHCLYCENTNLCHECYENFEHGVHDKYVSKLRSDGAWVVASDRNRAYLKVQEELLKIYEGVTQDLIGMYNLEEMPEHIKEMKRKLQKKRMSVQEHIVSCFPYMKDVKISKELEDMRNQFREHKITNRYECIICGEQNGLVRKLFCGHGIDDQCLSKLIFEQKVLQCPLDRITFLKGYASVFLPEIAAQQQQAQQEEFRKNQQKNE